MGCVSSTEKQVPFASAHADNKPTTTTTNNTKYPIYGSASIMKSKAHGTSDTPVQNNLRWACDKKTADRICNYNRHYAEHFGYFTHKRAFMEELSKTKKMTFYDSNTGLPLFEAPVNRTWREFWEESKQHGWPSFRDEEVDWENVRCLRGGEVVSLAGTHLGHNLPDKKGNRYCINLVSIAGRPVEREEPVEKAETAPSQ
jgi:peptide methionine sulfoxide reductase MsrB